MRFGIRIFGGMSAVRVQKERARKSVARHRTRFLFLEHLEERHMLASDWQNPFVSRDISGDGIVIPEDAIMAINELNNHLLIDSAGNLPARAEHPTAPYYDINGDGVLVPLDALSVINALNGDQVGPAITAQLANDTASGGGVNDDGLTSDGTISGRVVDDLTGVAKLTVQIDAGVVQPATFARDGSFSFVTNLTDGLHTVCFSATDGQGHESSKCGFEFTLDTIPSDPPSNVTMDSSSDTGSSNSDGVTNDNTPTFRGEASAGTLVTLFANNQLAGTVVANSPWEITAQPLNDGHYDFSVTSQDAAGNSSVPVTSSSLTIDTTPPDAPHFVVAIGISTQTAEGGAEAGSLVTAFVDGQPAGTATANGIWRITVGGLSNGQHTVTATAKDAAGNISPSSDPVVINVFNFIDEGE